MGKFRMASGGHQEYDDSEDRDRLYNKSLNMIDNKTDGDIGRRTSHYVDLQRAFKKKSPSLQQTKQDVRNLLNNND